MARSAPDRGSSTGDFRDLPLRVGMVASCHVAARRWAYVLPAAIGLSVLLGTVAVATVAEPSSLGALFERPLATAQIAAGLALWAALLAVPASRGIARFWARREVVIDNGMVEIVGHTPLGKRCRSVPLGDYQGLAHHIRASLSGLSHEIVLVHAERELTVTLISAERVTVDMLEDAKSLLGLPEIPARAIYERNWLPVRATAPNALRAASA